MQIPLVAERELSLLCFLGIHVLRGKDSLSICAVVLCLSFSRALSDNGQVYVLGVWEQEWKIERSVVHADDW